MPDSATSIDAALPTSVSFNLRPLLIANMACTMAMMAFVSLIGPIGLGPARQ